jgi:glycosyltransferase involved in cell wall biosynthesis
LFIFTQYFTPSKKAGGPITSISNLVTALDQDFSIVSRGQDLNERENLEGIQVDTWINSKKNYFVGLGFSSIRRYYKMLKSNSKEVFYINGIFDWKMNLLPMMIGKKLIISPRGMLQQGALKNGSIKKGFYLAICRYQLKKKDVIWHATDEVEAKDIELIFGNIKVEIIPNIIKDNRQKISKSEKEIGQIKFIYFSLISEKKNLLFFLKLLNHWNGTFTLDIYGPDKDESYVNSCKEFVSNSLNLTGRVHFHGLISIEDFKCKAERYDYFVLPTAIVESLSVGLPVIISNKTPWIFEKMNYSFALDLDNTDQWFSTFDKVSEMNNNMHLQARFEVLDYFNSRILSSQNRFVNQYHSLFKQQESIKNPIKNVEQ